MVEDDKNNLWARLKAIYKKEDHNTIAYEAEENALKEIITKIEEKSGFEYEIKKPLGRGGSGVVFLVEDKKHNVERALKIPRPKDDYIIGSVQNEIGYLVRINHENIIKLYNIGEVDIDGFGIPIPYFIMDYIKHKAGLSDYVRNNINTITDYKQLNAFMYKLAGFLNNIAGALRVLHKSKIIHFDVKPSNIFIETFDKQEKPLLCDLGFARRKTKSKVPLRVGFTYFYAHRRLTSGLLHMTSFNRVKKDISPSEFDEIFDIYAFGKTILEVLSIIEGNFPYEVGYDYYFVYLHLMACRMLDGSNKSDTEIKKLTDDLLKEGYKYKVFKELWLDLDEEDLNEIKYNNDIDNIILDFEKLFSPEKFLERLPELDRFYAKRVQCGPLDSAPFTPRVRALVEHPVFARLSNVPQLGLINTIFPTATHNRLEHSIGVLNLCVMYLVSLFEDPYNPLFRQIMGEKELKAIIVASLLHDIGQFPLAHEIEDVLPGLRHESIGVELLENNAKDKNGKTIADILVGAKPDSWRLSKSLITLLINKSSTVEDGYMLFDGVSKLKNEILRSILNGPIDIDKADYLFRDSENAFLPYGKAIDFPRLIRNLTLVLKPTRTKLDPRLALYEKGKTAGESFAFARYLLYESLYWHHTARAYRVMLHRAIQGINDKQRFINTLKESVGIGLDIIPSCRVETILEIIKDSTDATGQVLISQIAAREYYKRICTVHHDETEAHGAETLIDKFRSKFNKNPFGFESDLHNRITAKLDGLDPNAFFNGASRIDDLKKTISKEPHFIICDAPDPSPGSSTATKGLLLLVPEPQRMQRIYTSRNSLDARISAIWSETYNKLMKIAAKGRVFCHPSIRHELMSFLSPSEIHECIESCTSDNHI